MYGFLMAVLMSPSLHAATANLFLTIPTNGIRPENSLTGYSVLYRKTTAIRRI